MIVADRFTKSRKSAEWRGRSSETLAALLLQLKFYRILGRRVRTPGQSGVREHDRGQERNAA